ncbi:AAA family ATPase [Larsenimonas rhizosphaerae]|uniref:Nuclease SbcCD subunit C n=1 Tax=Larsenimonas rhizosphaerae TaxID=2944682 RepID=A0AA42CWS7_9GAMM|nr:AAA family ATPase [Larsenimonas rhizosphaerae]MCX2522998.1 AAA family ATPase [Larsenimonas rhizosphaerae]
MRIQRLVIHNLASLAGPHTIDFDAGPLASCGLFAITGPTGAGKSTLLDALCLALYGTTPRLRHATQQSAKTPDVEGDSLAMNDPRTLLRRGASQGFAEVTFIGIDNAAYTARWSVRRARDKAGGRLQASDQQLVRVSDNTVLNRHKREFQAEIAARLGLGFEQFTRSVLLAQSEFSAFLNADDNARSELLEKLTDTDIYSRLSREAYQREKTARDALDALTQSQAHAPPADDETREVLEQQEQDTHHQWQTLNARQQHLTTQRHWLEHMNQLQTAHQAASAHYQGAMDTYKALEPQRQWRDQLKAAAPLRENARALTREHQACQRAARELADARRKRQAARHTRRQAGILHQQARRQQQEAAEQRDAARPHLDQARTLSEAIRHDLRRMATLAEQHREGSTCLEALQSRRDRVGQTCQATAEQIDAVMARRADITDPSHWRRALQETRQTTWQQLQFHQAMLSHLAYYRQAKRDHESSRQALEDHRQTSNAAEADYRAAEEALATAEQARTSGLERITRQRQVRLDAVLTLRRQLTPHTPCPVCGSEEHPYLVSPPVSPEAAQLAAMEAEEQRQEQEFHQNWQAATATAHEARVRREVLERQYTGLVATRDQTGQALNEARARLDTEGIEVSDAPDIRCTELEAECTRLSRCHADAEQALSTFLADEEALVPLRERKADLASELAVLDNQHETLRQELAHQQNEQTTLEADLARQKARLRELLAPFTDVDAWQQQLDQAFHQAAQRETESAEALRHHEQAGIQATEQAWHALATLRRIHERIHQLEQSQQAWQAAHPQLSGQTLQQLMTTSSEELATLEENLQQAWEALTRAEAASAAATHHRDRHLDTSPLADTASLPVNDDHALTTTLDAQEAQLDETLAALTPELSLALDARDDAMAQRREDDQRRQTWRDLAERIHAARAEHQRWGQISQLIGSADGKAFRRIAQGYNLDRLVEQANLHLHQLARRYRLIRGGSPLGLLVIDQDMGDEQRSVHSLSGGEGFLISLALALGLASMASDQLAIDTLFIDEGFGSLDAQSLHMAMDALDALQAQGRQVGVISHVRDMIERIPVQVRLTPQGGGISTLGISVQGAPL